MDGLIFSMYNAWLLINYDKKTQDILKWVANAFILVTAIVLSVSIAASLMPITYMGFLIAHVIWGFFAWKIKDNALLTQFLILIPIDLYAMYIRL